MKKIMTISLFFITSTLAHAGIMVLSSMPEGLRKGSFELIIKHQNGVFMASGPVVNAYDHRYDFLNSFGQANSIITDKGTINPSLFLSLTCANASYIDYKLSAQQLNAPESIVINPPANCGI